MSTDDRDDLVGDVADALTLDQQVQWERCARLVGAGVALGDVVEEVRPVGFGSARRHLGHAPPGQGFGRHEHIAASAASVLVVFARRLTRCRRNRFARLTDQLPGRLVHAHHRKGRIVGTPVDVENLLHRRREVRVALWGNHPADPPPEPVPALPVAGAIGLGLLLLGTGGRALRRRARG